MKNLIVESQQTNVFSDHNYIRYDHCLSCYDPDKDRFYTIGGTDNRLIGIDVVNDKKQIDQKVYFKTDNAKPVGMEYSSIEQELYIATDEGRVYQFTPNPDSPEDRFWHDEIADFPVGLQALSLSPDQEIVVLLTRDFNVITLSAKFNIIKETNIATEEFGEKQFITVGWGKKETQFHGTEGKAAAKAQQTVSGKTDTDNGLPKITWKGDGSLFAISYIDSTTRARKFKVLDREGELQYTSELVDGLEGTLSWKPSGNLIASSRKLPNKHTIALFEKNGLLHREFTLPFDMKKKIQIQDLVWSRDSDVLSVWYKDLDTGVTNIDLWSEKNYHWYLKKSINYPKTNPVLYAYWYPQVKRDLLVLSCRNSTVYTFYWGVSHSNGKQLTDKAVVGVIDNNKVLLTCFKDGIIPPPMAQQTLEFKKPINAITFFPNGSENTEINSNDFLVSLSNNKILHCTYINDSWDSQYEVKKMYNIDLNIKEPHKYSSNVINHIFWYKPKIILCSVSLGNRSSLCELDLMDIDVLDEILIDAKIIHEMPGQIEHIIPSPDSQSAYIVVDSKLYTYNDRDGLKRSQSIITDQKLTRAVTKIEFVKFGDKEILVALSRKHVLYVDEKQIANNVTSFFVHSEFLLITTMQHALICFKLDEHGLNQLCTSDLTIQPWEKNSNEMLQSQEISIRRVERGSTLIIAVAKDARTILQMPRGNLECIQPRALSLAIIGSFIDELNYFKAFDAMRKQRIDLNLLYDHDPVSFINNAEEFVSEIKNSNWLSLFLTELKEEDITRTLYASSYLHRKNDEAVEKDVEEICCTLREILERNSNEYMQPILISLVKSKKTANLENALRRIKELKLHYEQQKGSTSPEEALKYLLYMVDVSVLFDIALGMYDFELVMFVAQKSQKDPKEYISFLNDLKKLEENYMKYKIDSHLKRYNSALEHIAKIPDEFDECLTFMQNHELYNKAIKLYSSQSEEYRKIALAYGKFLVGKTKYHEAGIMYYKAGDYEEALFAFKLANSWKDAIVTALKLNLTREQLVELYEDLVRRLLEEKKFDEAAAILSKHLNRLEDAVATLCEGRHWHQAWTDAYCMKREDLIETHVKPGLLDHADFTLTQLRQHKEDFDKHKKRLAVVRSQAAARDAAMRSQFDLDDDGAGRGDFSDLISDTTSIAGSTMSRSSQASRSTGRSYRSSKNRRKHERKMQSIKEGSVYEDLALIRALHQLVSNAYKMRDEIRSIAEMLLLINHDTLAEELYKVMSDFLSEIYKGKREIWPPAAENKSLGSEEPSISSSTSMNQQSPINIPSNLMDPRLMQVPEEKTSNWKLDVFSIL